MRAIIATSWLALCLASAASAQLATIDGGSAPIPMDGIAAVGTPGAAVPDETRGLLRDCEEQARAFRARNAQSPSRRQQALESCLAAADARERVDVAGP